MFRELFFIFKSEKDASQSKLLRVESLNANHTDVVNKVLSMAGASLADCSYIYAEDKAHGFEYALIRLANDVSEEVEKQIKHAVVYDSLKGVCDVFFSEAFPCFNETHKQSGALVMDMDMTSVQIEGIDEIARCLGVYNKVAEITFEAMNGKLDFNQSLTRRVALLEDGDAINTLAKVKEIMVETDGLGTLLNYCNTLKKDFGFKTCIASGGFHELICVLEEKYGLDHVRANRFEIKDGKFTGHTVGQIVNGQGKAALIVELKASGINKNNIISLGDGANDLLMMNEAGLGIAYHAKPKVQEQARNAMNVGDLSSVSALMQMTNQL